tara:strand:+ start:544 stop:666 length:123 start_codon:yes stop_codon:yes gene_type:complete
MTVSRLRTELTDTELIYFASYYELKGEREEAAMNKARHKK